MSIGTYICLIFYSHFASSTPQGDFEGCLYAIDGILIRHSRPNPARTRTTLNQICSCHSCFVALQCIGKQYAATSMRLISKMACPQRSLTRCPNILSKVIQSTDWALGTVSQVDRRIMLFGACVYLIHIFFGFDHQAASLPKTEGYIRLTYASVSGRGATIICSIIRHESAGPFLAPIPWFLADSLSETDSVDVVLGSKAWWPYSELSRCTCVDSTPGPLLMCWQVGGVSLWCTIYTHLLGNLDTFPCAKQHLMARDQSPSRICS